MTIFAKPGFDFTLPTFQPHEAERVDRFRLQAAAGEFEPVSIGLYAHARIDSLRARVTDFVGSRGTISSAAADLRIVKVWRQSGIHVVPEPDNPVEVPELLVYDDSQELRAPFDVEEERFVDGRHGRALHIDSTYALVLPTDGWDANRGTLDFWFRPHWSAPEERSVRFLFSVRSSETDEVGLFYDGRRGRLMGVVDRGDERYRSTSIPIELQASRWYRVTFTWDSQPDGTGSFACAVDGELVFDFGSAFAAGTMPPLLYVGSQNGRRYPADADFDQLVVYRRRVDTVALVRGDFADPLPLYRVDFESHAEVAGRSVRFRRHARRLPVLARDFHTQLPAQTSKQLWLTVEVPAEAKPGTYTANVVLETRDDLRLEVPVELEVLDFGLVESPRYHGMYFGHLHPGTSQSPNAVSDAEYFDALRDLARHGLNSVRVPWISEERFTRTLDLAERSGLNGLIILSAPSTREIVPLAQRIARERGFELYFYGIDECNRDDRLVQQIPLSRWIRDAGGRVTTALLKQTQDRLCDPNDSVYDLVDLASGQSFRAQGVTGECIDLPIYHATYIAYAERANGLNVDLSRNEPLHDYCRAVFADPGAKSSRLELYYWPSWTQRPNVNRIMSGFFLWASGMDGAFPHQYMALSDHFNDVYDDFDNVGVPERDMMTAYPSASGPIPTTQWEAMREGIDDLRYVATLTHVLGQLSKDDALRRDLEAKLHALLEDYIDPARFFDPHFSDEYTPAKFNQDRERIIRWIQRVRSRITAQH